MKANLKLTPWVVVFSLAGLGNLSNGLWMLLQPAGWYHYLPGAIPDFGPLNEHFVRDLGTMFITFGLLLFWAAVSVRVRIPVVAGLSCWYVIHAGVHVFDTARGFVPSVHWLVDIPLCYAPAVLMVGMLIALVREASNGKAGA